jgi:TonB-linked SusC/RagA family outer membrane protein
MKLTTLMILLVLMDVGASVYSQNTRLSLETKNSSLSDIFQQIEQQSDFRFFYQNEQIVDVKAKSIDVRNESVEGILNEILENTGLSYRIVDKHVLIYSKQQRLMSGVQVKKVSGNVKDSSGEPLPGVTVMIKGTTIGTITSIDGSFSLADVPADATLVFSFIGMDTQEIVVMGKQELNVILLDSMESIDEVVVTALNINRKKQSLGYSLTAVDGEEINQAKETNVVNSLKGRVAGLQISQTAGGVGSSTRIVLRGIASLSSSNRPLFVVDGVAMSDGGNARTGIAQKDMGNAISELDPETIESISVLKGAGASAAYGSRGANGVILVTTKKGRQQGFGVSFSSSYDINQPVLYTELQNKYGQGIMGMYPPVVDPETNMPSKAGLWVLSFGPEMKGQTLPNFAGIDVPFSPQPNNVLDFYRNGSTLTNSVTLDAGNERASFLMSLTNVESKGVSPNNSLSRQNFNVRGTMKVGDILELDGKMTYSYQKVNNRVYMEESAGNAMWNLTMMPRNMRLEDLRNNTIDEDGNELKFQDEPASSNPYWMLNNLRNYDKKHHVISFASAKVNLASWLNLKIQSGLDYNHLNSHEEFAPGSSEPRLNIKGGLSNQMTNGIEWNSDVMLNASKDISKRVSGTLHIGGNYRYSDGYTMNQRGIGLNVPDLYHISNASEYSTGYYYSKKGVYSAISLASLTYDQWLYFDLSLRNDWSSTLPADNNSYFYHSENLSLLFTKALGMSSTILSNGRIRGSYGRVGNDTGAHRTNQYYGIAQSNFPYPLGQIGGLAHFDLKPELTDSWEVGTNLYFFRNRLELDVAYYDRSTKNQIMAVPIPGTSGYTSKIFNAGEIKNTGLELLVNATILKNSALKWDVSVNAARNYSEVVELHEDLESIDVGGFFNIGRIIAKPGEPFGSIYADVYERDDFGDRYIDDKGFPVKGGYEKVGDINPDLTGGIRNSFSYKNIDLSFLIDFQLGGEFISGSKYYQYTMGTSSHTLAGREEWYSTHNPDGSPIEGMEEDGPVYEGININTGEPNTVPLMPAYYYTTPFSQNIGEEFIMDATNVRMRELVLSYRLPNLLLAKTPIKKASLSLTGRNLFFLYRANQYADPEGGYSSGSTGTGIEHSPLPSTRSIGVQLRVNF